MTQGQRHLPSASTEIPCDSNGKESAYDAGDQGSIPGLGSSSGEGNSSPLQYSHSNTLAWKIPWTEEPGRLQSVGSLESDTTDAT